MKQELIKLFRQCETEAAKWSDNPVTFEYFINWLENQETTE